jgi:hypothetical protein
MSVSPLGLSEIFKVSSTLCLVSTDFPASFAAD